MRMTKPVELHDVSQVLTTGSCPVCTLLKNDQAALLRNHVLRDDAIEICNFHGWALAAASDSDSGAQAFLNVLRGRTCTLADADRQCTFCSYLAQHELTHIREILEQMEKPSLLDWMQQHGTFCLVHAGHIRELAPPRMHPVIDHILERNKKELQARLENLLRRSEGGKGAGGGILGRAAEFLVAQRGIHP